MVKRPTQDDVARLAGVSRATVSMVVNGVTDGRVPISPETRLRVTRAIEELGYEPDARAQALRSGDTRIIGLIVPDVRNPHYWDNIAGVERYVRAAGYNLMFTNLSRESDYTDEIFKDLLRQRVDGMILMGAYIDDSDMVKKAVGLLRKSNLAIVEITDRLNPEPIDCVHADYRESSKALMEHLIALGHRRIGFLYGVFVEHLGMDRLEPYYHCLQAAGLADSSSLVERCEPNIESGYQAALRLLSQPNRPTALLVINDLLAMGAMRAAADLNLRIPDDLSLAGFDDIFIDVYLSPRLTSVTKDAAGMGRAAAEMVMRRIEDPNRPRQVVGFPSRLILRESTGPAPAAASGKPGGPLL